MESEAQKAAQLAQHEAEKQHGLKRKKVGGNMRKIF